MAPRSPKSRPGIAGPALAAGIFLLFGTPLRVLWVDAPGSWWLVYALWLAAIGVAFGVRRGA